MKKLNLASSLSFVLVGLAACAVQPAGDDDDEAGGVRPVETMAPASCSGVPDGTVEERIFYAAASVPYGQTCEPHVQSCTCSAGEWICQGPLTETFCEVLCPDQATRVGGADDAPVCECQAGYVLEDAACSPACPDHSHWDDVRDGCVCDPDYFVNEQRTACVYGDDLCPEHSFYEAAPDGELHCLCDPGYVVNWDRDACVLPGEECPAGRPKMVVNGVVIICCPADAVAVQYSSSTGATCLCPEGQAYDESANECS